MRAPPLWTRRLVPWAALHWLADRADVCWSAIVMWKIGYDGHEDWSVKPSCFNAGHCDLASCPHHYDYCGRFERLDPLVRAPLEEGHGNERPAQ